MGKAVFCAAPAFDEEVLVALAAALDALEAAEEATEAADETAELALEASELAPAEALEATELAPSEAVEATDEAPDAPDPVTPPMPKMVVEPIVEVPTAEPPDEMTDSMAEVVIAEEVPVMVVEAEVTRVVAVVPAFRRKSVKWQRKGALFAYQCQSY
jgi:hypothetical protein